MENFERPKCGSDGEGIDGLVAYAMLPGSNGEETPVTARAKRLRDLTLSVVVLPEEETRMPEETE
jgi:hypothetical protein